MSTATTWIYGILTSWLRFLWSAAKGVGTWLRTPSMNKLLVVAVPLAAYVFWRSVHELAEFSSIPLAWVLSASMCGIYYLIDRIGFSKVDTITIINNDWRIHALTMGIYALFVLAGHYYALAVFSN